jgi:hypothetical protein
MLNTVVCRAKFSHAGMPLCFLSRFNRLQGGSAMLPAEPKVRSRRPYTYSELRLDPIQILLRWWKPREKKFLQELSAQKILHRKIPRHLMNRLNLVSQNVTINKDGTLRAADGRVLLQFPI